MMCGMGELHLEILIDRLKTHYKVPFTTGPISIAYRYAIAYCLCNTRLIDLEEPPLNKV